MEVNWSAPHEHEAKFVYAYREKHAGGVSTRECLAYGKRDYSEEANLRVRSWCATGFTVVATLFMTALIVTFAVLVALDTRDRIRQEILERRVVKDQCELSYAKEGCGDPETLVPAMEEFCESMQSCRLMDEKAIHSRSSILVAVLLNAFPVVLSYKSVLLGIFLVLAFFLTRRLSVASRDVVAHRPTPYPQHGYSKPSIH
ncbi:hypothetical protein NDN08_003682 [Rhodosorus marinus]|uniref:Brl1/Brr6 domain-containing protein n=1 Tax=Rhodosorus marinus TaxID=101924 RepID=A0AAV8V029_9RHOD|nr:hypothetical protein NDN08_003682 [Rhodosorus marinus]